MSTLLNKIKSRKRTLLAGVLFLLTIIILIIGLRPSEIQGGLNNKNEFADYDKKNQIQTSQPIINNYFSLEEISDIDRVTAAAGAMDRVIELTNSQEPVELAILPHHTLAAERLAEFWQEIAQTTKPSVIVIAGPNHEELGQGVVQTTTGIWETPAGQVKTDDALVNTLVQAKSATKEPDSFAVEHTIGVQLPFIAELFPGVPIVPVIAKSTAGQRAAASVLFGLNKALPDNALLVVSMDFSHDLPLAQSQEKDRETLQAINAKDYGQIDKFGSEYLDSSFGLDLALLWETASDCEREMIWHGQSSEFSGRPNEPGTSYFVFFCRADDGQDPLIITAVGDVMLSRGVGGVLDKTTVENAVSEVRPYFQDTDLGFANLESVFSADQTTTCSKPYCFKANPAYVEFLKQLKIDHVSVSNNHNYDYGRKSFADSLAHLSEANIAAVGGYQNANVPAVTEINDKAVVMLAFDATTYTMNADQVKDEIAEAPSGDILIVSFHWGVEYQHYPTAKQKELAHAAVEAGADLVIGHHPHVLQGIEKYQDGLILYSLGNFVFDQFGFDENESLIVQAVLSKDSRQLRLQPVRIEGFLPRLANQPEREQTLARLASWSDSNLKEAIQSGIIIW